MKDYSKLSSMKELDEALDKISLRQAALKKAISRDTLRTQSLTRPSNLVSLGLRSVNVGGTSLEQVLLGLVRTLRSKVEKL